MRQMKKKMIIAVIVTLLITAGIAFAISHFQLKGKDEEIAELRTQAADAMCLGFANDLKVNSIITQEDIIPIAIKGTSQASGTYTATVDENGEITSVELYKAFEDENNTIHESRRKIKDKEILTVNDLVGRVVKVNVSKNTLISEALLYPENAIPTLDERLQEFNFLQLPSDLLQGDYIDVRIRFQNGEDYSVLIGKKVERIAGENTIFIQMNEEEIMAMGSAIIEAYMQEGVSLYANKYVDPGTQLFKENIVDYVAKYDYAVNRLIEEKYEKELRRVLAGMLATNVSGESMLDDAGNIIYPVLANNVMDAQGTIATEDTTTIIPVIKELVEKENEKGKKEEVEVSYISAEMLAVVTAVDKQKAEVQIQPITVDDFKIEDIANYAGIDFAYVDEIKLAQAENDTDVINFYRIMRVTTRESIIRSYPVRQEVLAVIKNNPNLLETVIAEFDAKALLNTRIDEYHTLRAQYEAELDPYTKQEIKQKMDELVSTRTENIEENMKEEIEAQRAERVAYLESLIDDSSTAE